MCCTRGGCGPAGTGARGQTPAPGTSLPGTPDPSGNSQIPLHTNQNPPQTHSGQCGCLQTRCFRSPSWVWDTASPAPAPQCPHPHGGCPKPELSPHLWAVQLQIWELLPFQVSIAQEAAVLKGTGRGQASYPAARTPNILSFRLLLPPHASLPREEHGEPPRPPQNQAVCLRALCRHLLASSSPRATSTALKSTVQHPAPSLERVCSRTAPRTAR